MLLPDNYAPPSISALHTFHGLRPTAAAKLALELAEQLDCAVLLVAGDGRELDHYQQSLQLFAAKDGDSSNLLIPDRETLPYDHFSPHPDIQSARLRSLYEMRNFGSGVAVCSIGTLLTRLCPLEHIEQNSLVLERGQQIDIEQFRQRLVEIGYQARETVYEHGEFALRGSVLDLFPMGSELPYRIELFDDEIESLRSFDQETQRSIERMEQLSILPAGEVALDTAGVNQFRDQWHSEFDINPDLCPIYQDTVEGLASAGIEAWLPMFFSQTASLFDYLPQNTLIVSSARLAEQTKHFLEEVQQRFEQNAIDPTRPLLSPDRLYMPAPEMYSKLKGHARIALEHQTDETGSLNQARGEYRFYTGKNPELLIDEHSLTPLALLQQSLAADTERSTYLLCVESHGRREVLHDKLEQAGIPSLSLDSWPEIIQAKNKSTVETDLPQLILTVSAIHQGVHLPREALYIVAEAELFGVNTRPARSRKAGNATLVEATINSLMELREGAPIVHIDHGIGRYRGLSSMSVPAADGQVIAAEFLTLEYAGGDKLYVPVTSLHLVSRYMGGDEDSAGLNRLGTESWGNTRRKVVAQIHDVAAELLAVYAKRHAMPGFAHTLDMEEYHRFAEQFPFEETDDQQQTIDAVLADMQSEQVMDRLVCGDVGFGKTEVAIRAAFVAAQNSKQVMLLVPTTLLAQQHYQNFVDRFASWPLRIDTLSRFRTAAEQKKVLASFNGGNTDILIGTHKLLQQDVKVRDLGLVIVDEEHRFGVRQKDQLKKLCANVDLLTMTATPIPRTLNMAMAGLRDLSIIATPPARRLSVKTFVQEKQNSLIKEAVLRELLRGGQVFYLHNDVATIDRTRREISELIPEARIAVGHGQMPERELEQVMLDFYHKKFNILLCTTIIETGIDIPNANTIIIERADKFGLAQLHQLRGRVGRSHHQAYAYLFIASRKSLTKDAERRLQAVEEAQDLGAGFMLATHDLEIRGAGELLGAEQSGQIQSIGFSMYLDMLERAVAALKAGEDIDLSAPIAPQGEINVHVSAIIPDSYLPDIHNRLTLYKRIANAENSDQLRELQVEMIDRFGLLTDEIKNLFAIMQVKQRALPLGIAKIDLGPKGGYIEFGSNTPIDPMKIVTLVQQQPDVYQLKSATRLTIQQDLPNAQHRIQWLQQFVDSLNAA